MSVSQGSLTLRSWDWPTLADSFLLGYEPCVLSCPPCLQHQLHKHGWLHEAANGSCERAGREGLDPDVEALNEACAWQKSKREKEPVLRRGKWSWVCQGGIWAHSMVCRESETKVQWLWKVKPASKRPCIFQAEAVTSVLKISEQDWGSRCPVH